GIGGLRKRQLGLEPQSETNYSFYATSTYDTRISSSWLAWRPPIGTSFRSGPGAGRKRTSRNRLFVPAALLPPVWAAAAQAETKIATAVTTPVKTSTATAAGTADDLTID